MEWHSSVYNCLFGAVLLLSAAQAQASIVSCYDDDSLDIINQDEIPPPAFPGGPYHPLPGDCNENPAVSIDQNGNVFMGSDEIYAGLGDPAVEARVAPTKAVGILTERGRLYTHTQGTKLWLKTPSIVIKDFKMARDGGLIAENTEGVLVRNGASESGMKTVSRLYAARNGRVVALLTGGVVLDNSKTLYERGTDPAQSLKVAENGVVVWLTENGNVGSTRPESSYDNSVDHAKQYKINASGRMANLTGEGRLYRDGVRLGSSVSPVNWFKIFKDGSVSAKDDEGRSYSFPP